MQHARLCSIYRKSAEKVPDLPKPDQLANVDLSPLFESAHAADLVRQLASWPDVFLNTLKTQEPTTVLTYLCMYTPAFPPFSGFPLSYICGFLLVEGYANTPPQSRCPTPSPPHTTTFKSSAARNLLWRLG